MKKKKYATKFARYTLPAVLISFVILITVSLATAERIEVGYVEFPPHFFTSQNGTANGTLIELATRIFNKAGIEFEYRRLPAKRILLNLEHGNHFASVGWFKNPEREKIALYSLPIYVNKPIGLLVLNRESYKFEPYKTLEAVMRSNRFKIGLISGHSGGPYVDPIMEKYPENTITITGSKLQLVKMLKNCRVDGVILAPEEMPLLVQESGYDLDDFAHIKMNDIPEGNKRYIVFSHSTDQKIVEKVNRAILELIGNLSENPPKTD
ncbi:substrate-binding periplasmic protein [Maridesulfovibrio sp. FT414]|uniref:substrate-binding periplasmic protein n=1 Tax=Maridesulfovibrio sp. FT414 TaxID=2979469 RepID=UPI003D809823